MSKGERGKGRPPSPEERRLWRSFARGIEPLPRRGGSEEESPPVQTDVVSPQPPASSRNPLRRILPHADFTPEFSLAPARTESASPRQPSTDRRTADKLRRGKMAIEATLDLHGMTQREAHERLRWFLIAACETNKRTVLVITGKGKRQGGELANWLATEPGVLRRKLPEWLALPPLRDIVLDYSPARARDGGDGAWYILLRRKRPA